MVTETKGAGRLMIRLCLGLVVLLPAATTAAVAENDTGIADAAMNRDMAMVRLLADQGVDVNAPGRDGTPALHWVVRVGDLETAGLLIRAGADVSMPNRYGATPIYLACLDGNVAMIRLLLDAGADANSADQAGETAVMTAVRSGSFDAVKLLLDRGAVVDAKDPEFQQTALMVAVRENHPDIVQLLVDRGADVNARTRIGETPDWVLPNSVPGFSHGVGIFRGGVPERGRRNPIPGGMSPLLYAARDGRFDAAQILVEAGADLNQTDANDITPLLMAIGSNHIKVAQYLIERGAEINTSDWYGRTALWLAVDTRNMDLDSRSFVNNVDRGPVLELIRVLLERGADPNARTAEWRPVRSYMFTDNFDLSWADFTGQTPFLRASLAGDVAVMRLLLDHGADPHIHTYGDTTPLMAAAGINWVVDQTYDEGAEALLEAVKLCLELGMDINAVNSMGLAAIHGAANRGSDNIIQFLVEQGARLDIADSEGRTPLNWAQGVFLATHAAVPKPSSIELIKQLMGESQ